MVNKQYDWKAIQKYHNQGHGILSCMRKFGFANQSWYNAVERGEIVPNQAIHNLTHDIRSWLVSNRPQTSRTRLKERLIKEGYLPDLCAVCRITKWRGKKLSLHLDHINGIRTDNRIANLRLLCPNCHSQTSTYGGRNKRKKHEQLKR